MKYKVHCTAFLAVGLALITNGCEKKIDSVSTSRNASPTTQSTSATPSAPDNTARNKVDGSGSTTTPLDQSQSAADIKVTADIRRSIMDDKSMSTNAQNCKIVTDKSGMVTLRGVVNSQTEKDSIDAKAKAIAGSTKVDNQLEIKRN